MQQLDDTRARLISFFVKNPELVQIILSEPNNVEVWEEIFIYFFGEFPIDNPDIEVPDYWRKGSTDPRWDILLFKANLGAMKAMDMLVADWRSGAIAIPPQKEAA